jgi:mannobiose 2-epimerase
MNHHLGVRLGGAARTLAGALSRRQVLKLLAGGAVGGLAAGVAQEVLPAQAQSIYLPLLPNQADPPAGDDALCDGDPLCEGEDCCVSTTAVDFGWFRMHLLNDILPKWLRSVTDQGLFLPHFDRQWRPLNLNYGTVVTQCRLLYNFSEGYALTGDSVYRNAVVDGAQFLLDHFRDRQYGGWYWACNLDGSVRDKRKECYGHAFALFGLAHAYRCTGNRALQDAMLQTWDVLVRRFRDAYGGFHDRMTEDFRVSGTTKTQNPVMHIFEGLLAAGTVGKQPQLLDEARNVGNFVLNELVRAGDRRLPELYDLQWQEIPTKTDGSGGRINIGHAFEWAYLASYAAELGLPNRFLLYANSFLCNAMGLGFDWQNGGIYSPATSDGVIINREKGWWEQCEAIRALIHFALRRDRKELNGPLQRTLELVKGSFIDPQYGGWYPRIGPGITPTTLQKGGDWKVDYHIVIMCMEAIRLTQAAAAE